MLQNKFSRKL